MGWLIDNMSPVMTSISWQEILASKYLNVLVLGVAVYLLSRTLSPGKALKIPRVGKDPGLFNGIAAQADFLANGHSLIQEGYSKFKHSMFLVQTADMERVVLSNKYLEELRSLPETQLSLRLAMSERHLGQYTTIDTIRESHLQNKVCRVSLTQNLGRYTYIMSEEMTCALSRELSKSDTTSWHPYNAHAVLLNIISRVISRVFVGLPTCRDPEWLETSVGYTQDVFMLAGDLRKCHWTIRPIIYPFLASRKRVRNRLRTARKHIFPLLRSRASSKGTKHEDLLQWITDSAEGNDKSPDKLLLKVLFLCMASIHTSATTACQALFDICAMPKTVQPLRAEVLREVKAEGGFTLSATNNMKLLDSFLKESQRINHPGSLSFNRKVLQDLTLSDGLVLRAGTFISMPTALIARDPAYYSDPDTFRPSRFSDLRQSSPHEATRHQFTSTGPRNLAFGHGKFACPGRFFAAVQIKLLLAQLLLDYDVAFPEGQVERPPNLFVDERIIPHTAQVVMFRKRDGLMFE